MNWRRSRIRISLPGLLVGHAKEFRCREGTRPRGQRPGAATRVPNRFAIAFILITVVIDSMGIGLIMPVMPDLIRELRGTGLSEAALWGGVLAASFAVMQFLFGPFLGESLRLLRSAAGAALFPRGHERRLSDPGVDGIDLDPVSRSHHRRRHCSDPRHGTCLCRGCLGTGSKIPELRAYRGGFRDRFHSWSALRRRP